MVEFRQLVYSFILIGVFVFAFVNFSIHLTADNDVNNTLMEHPVFNQTYGNLQAELESKQDDADLRLQAQEEDLPSEEIDEIPQKNIIAQLWGSAGEVRTTYDLVISIIKNLFQISPVVMSAITSILVISIGLLIWSVIKSGR